MTYLRERGLDPETDMPEQAFESIYAFGRNLED